MTLTTRATIRQEYCRQTGGIVADLTGAGTTTTFVSTNMIGRSLAGDDNYLTGWTTYDGTEAAGDLTRIIASHVDTTGVSTITVAIAGAKGGSETIEYYPKGDPGGAEANEALDTVMRNTSRVVEAAIPTVEGSREHTLLNMPWIEAEGDILDAFIRNSPNLVDNSGFELWGVGSNAGLHGWVLSGTGATVTRVDGTYGRYAARLTATGGNGAVLTQTIPIPIVQLYDDSVVVFGRVKTSTAAGALLQILDGDTASGSAVHDGGGDWDELTRTATIGEDASGPLQIQMRMTANGSADFETVVAARDNVPDWLSKHGNQHAVTSELVYSPQVSGTMPMLRTPEIIGQGRQIIVVSRQPYFPMTADSSTGGITDMPIDCAVSGLIVEIAKRQVGKPNAAKWAELLRVHRPRYINWKKRLAKKPQRGTTDPVLVMSV